MDLLNEQDTVHALARTLQSEGSITLWTEDKRKDFAKTFDNKAKAARFILYRTAEIITDAGLKRQFIGSMHTTKIWGEKGKHWTSGGHHRIYDDVAKGHYYSRGEGSVGGRAIADLNLIAEERAKHILNELPAVQDAVLVIDAVTGKKMIRREQLEAKAKDLVAKLEELGGKVLMSEVDQDMSVRAFRKYVVDRIKARRPVADKLKEVTEEIHELRRAIDKALYRGLPGLADAVVKVAKQHVERSYALDAVSRQVQDRVIFGDSAAALEMLQGFEKDEVTVSDAVKAEFSSALEKLKLLGIKNKKKKKKSKK